MAIEDWINYDVDSDDCYGRDEDFDVPCKWCGKKITMSRESGDWKPCRHGEVHVCPVRLREAGKAMLKMLPDLTLPECQFCHEPMKYRRVESDPEEGPGMGWAGRQLSCLGCGSTGPVEKGNTDLS